MKYQIPELRYTNARVLGEIGFAYLLIASAVLPAVIGIIAILALGAKDGSALWMAIQVSIVGTAVGAYLSKLRGSLGEFERATDKDQRDLDYSALVKRLYRNPTLEYVVLGCGSFAARAFVAVTSALAVYTFGDFPLAVAIGISVAIQWHAWLSVALLFVGVLALLPLPPLPLVGTLGIPSNIGVGLLMLALPMLFGTWQKVRYKRVLGEGGGDDKRELASGSTFYVAHEVVDGLLVDAIDYGGGFERARDGITLATVESQSKLEQIGWKPAVGDLHKGQTVNTSELVAALRDAANADSATAPVTLAQSLRDERQEAA